MAMGRPIPPIELTHQVRSELEGWSRSRTLAAGIARRARIVLMAADGLNSKTIAEQVGLSGAMVGMWRKRFLAQGLVGLYDEPRPGGPRSIQDEQVAELIRTTLQAKPQEATQWSCRLLAVLAERTGSTEDRADRSGPWREGHVSPMVCPAATSSWLSAQVERFRH